MWYYVYILELNDGKHYAGCTVNLKERFSRHKKGYVQATKDHRPLKLVGAVLFMIGIKHTILNVT
ncbi:MAG: GIY-YIG nuclease family protein [Mucilaginibacter sp.]